jgi:hypothetical protein
VVREFLLDLVPKFFGATSVAAVRIEAYVGIEILQESGVIALEKMDAGQQTVDGSHLRGQFAGFFRGREGFGDLLLADENTTELIVSAPEIRTKLNSLANDAFGVRIGVIQQESAEANIGFAVGVVTGFDGFAKSHFGQG